MKEDLKILGVRNPEEMEKYRKEWRQFDVKVMGQKGL